MQYAFFASICNGSKMCKDKSSVALPQQRKSTRESLLLKVPEISPQLGHSVQWRKGKNS